MTPNAYFIQLNSVAVHNPFVLDTLLSMTEAGVAECYIKGQLVLAGRHILHVAEYVITEPVLKRVKYRFQFQDSQGVLLRRWDNSPHHRYIATFPYHCHLPGGRIVESPPMDLQAVLTAIIPLLGV